MGEIRIDGDRVRAAVKGSRPRPYEVWVRREGDRFISQCNCPSWGGSRVHCKHVAALLFTLGRSGLIEPAESAPGATEAHLPSPAAWLLEDTPIQAPISVDYLVAFERDWLKVQQLASDHARTRHPPERARLAPEDRRLHDLLVSLGLPSPPGFRVEIERAGDLLAALRGRPVFLDEHRQIPLVFSDDTLGLRVVTPAGSDGLGPFRFVAVLAARGDSRSVPLEKAELLGGVQSFAIVDDQAYPLDSRLSIRSLRRLALHPEVACRADELGRLFGEWFPRLTAATGASVPFASEVMPMVGGTPSLSLSCDGPLTSVEATLFARYGTAPPLRVEPRTGAEPVAELDVQIDEAGHPFLLERDRAAEAEALRSLAATGLTFVDGRFRAQGDTALQFWSQGVQALPAEWDRVVPERYRGLRMRTEPVRPSLRVGASSVGWFDVDLRFSSEDIAIDPEALRACLASNERYLTLSDGSFAPADLEACRAALEILEDLEGATAGKGKLPNWMAGSLGALIASVGPGATVAPEAAARLARLGDPVIEAVPLPAGLNGQLRPYQVVGYGWLRSLRDLGGLGALLADEMGLGKTIQTLALLAAAKEETPDPDRGPEPALVVAPTSVIPNWVRECERFTPGLRVVAFSGGQRRLPAPGQVDLVVTSYALLRRDAKLLAARSWSTVVLDEAQNIKNPASATARAARELPAGFRIALTGTPVENRPLDLWSIFAFLTPDLLGKQDEFRRRYENATGEDAARAHRSLAARVRPFLRRRLKKDVLVELPDKLETEVVCELTPVQRSLYKQLLVEVRSQVFETIQRHGVERAQVSILAGLLRLRQVACDPRLLPLPRDFHEHDSAKLLLWRELLDEALDGDHRVVCFSQFVTMLTLMRHSLDRDGIEYAYLDGRIRDRQAVIDRFNSVDAAATKPAPRVMLISLRAGGTGINLASADTVMLYDPWWNPAVEDQAVDRVHRIGQSKDVSVYRLVARGTVEEKIFELKRRKRDLSGRLIGGEGGGAFTAADVEELLRLG